MKDLNLIYGKNPVIEAIRAKKALKVFVVNNFNDQKILSLINENHLNVSYISPNEMERMCDGMAIEAMEMCRKAGATFIIDDRVELVRELGADGVHLGLKDMPIADARRILGDRFIIGGTANRFEDVKAHWEAGADYIGCGPFRFTTTKKNLAPILGLEGYRNIISLMKEHGIEIPLVAIGGIEASDIPAIMETGVSGIALSGTVLRDENPQLKMKQIIDIIQHG